MVHILNIFILVSAATVTLTAQASEKISGFSKELTPAFELIDLASLTPFYDSEVETRLKAILAHDYHRPHWLEREIPRPSLKSYFLVRGESLRTHFSRLTESLSKAVRQFEVNEKNPTTDWLVQLIQVYRAVKTSKYEGEKRRRFESFIKNLKIEMKTAWFWEGVDLSCPSECTLTISFIHDDFEDTLNENTQYWYGKSSVDNWIQIFQEIGRVFLVEEGSLYAMKLTLNMAYNRAQDMTFKNQEQTEAIKPQPKSKIIRTEKILSVIEQYLKL